MDNIVTLITKVLVAQVKQRHTFIRFDLFVSFFLEQISFSSDLVL